MPAVFFNRLDINLRISPTNQRGQSFLVRHANVCMGVCDGSFWCPGLNDIRVGLPHTAAGGCGGRRRWCHTHPRAWEDLINTDMGYAHEIAVG